MSKPTIVAIFKKGDSVPEWLIAREPNNKRSIFVGFVFDCDCCIVEWEDDFILVAKSHTPPFYIQDAKDVTLSAASKSVVIPLMFQTMLSDSRRGEGKTITYKGKK